MRKQKELEVEDVADMTGFPPNTIRRIEDGNECTLSYFAAIALALEVHPKELLDFNIKLEPLFPLSIQRKEKTRLTARINKLIEENYFTTPRYIKDVCNHLEKEYKIKTTTSSLSVILARFIRLGKLSSKKQGRINLYYSGKYLPNP